MRLANENHVVMVDDNEGDVFLARQCFEESKLRNRWMSFSNGPDFLAYLSQVRAGQAQMPAIVLLDVNMPEMSGFEVLKATRADPHFAELPIFCLLTSSGDPRDRERAMELGASGFVTKPGRLNDYINFFNSLRPGADETQGM